MTKSCELCKSPAKMYCESDQASLCWECDAKVHSANFLVARHSRSLLCHVCQSPTAWSACGSKLGPTVSVCDRCAAGCDGVTEACSGGGGGGGGEEESEGGNDDETETEGDYDDDDDDGDAQVERDDEDGDNQVVPWSSTPPPPATSSSSSEESSSRFSDGQRDVSLERMRDNVADLCDDDDHGCSSSQRRNRTPSPPPIASAGDEDAGFIDSFSLRPLKTRRTEANRSDSVHDGPVGSRTAAVVESLRRFHQRGMSNGNNTSATIAGLRKPRKNPRADDLESSEYS